MSDISIVMGSKSDWPTVKETCDILDEFGVSYEKNVISAHRMPNEMFAFAQNAVPATTSSTNPVPKRAFVTAAAVSLPSARMMSLPPYWIA